jgi:hypothetical protein
VDRREFLAAAAALSVAPALGDVEAAPRKGGLPVPGLPSAGPVGDGVALTSVEHPLTFKCYERYICQPWRDALANVEWAR